MFLCPFEPLIYEIQTFLKIWYPPPRFSMFRICNSDFFDFGAYPPPPFGKSSQIFPFSLFDGFPKMCDVNIAPDCRICKTWCHRQPDKTLQTRQTRLWHHRGRIIGRICNTGYKMIRIFCFRNKQILNLVLGFLLELRLIAPGYSIQAWNESEDDST